jgi:hypothetical protein
VISRLQSFKESFSEVFWGSSVLIVLSQSSVHLFSRTKFCAAPHRWRTELAHYLCSSCTDSALSESLSFKGLHILKHDGVQVMTPNLNGSGTENRAVLHSPAQDGAQFAQNPAQNPIPEVVDGELLEDTPAVAAETAPPAIDHPAPYTSHELAAALGVAESTVRSRWLPWLQKVAPVELLVSDAGYTELARSLFSEFAQLPAKKTQREAWVKAAKERYSQEFMPGGVTPEGVPPELGSALALLSQQGSAMQTAADAELAALQALIQQQGQVEAEFDQAEIAAMRAAGAKRGVQRFQIETEMEDAAYYQLRKARTQSRLDAPPQPHP